MMALSLVEADTVDAIEECVQKVAHTCPSVVIALEHEVTPWSTA